MSWDGWRVHLDGEEVLDSAICGYAPGSEAVWSSTPGLAGITAAEIKMIVGADRSAVVGGSARLTIAGVKCICLQDKLHQEELTMDVKTKATETDDNKYGICIFKTKTALLFCKGKKDTVSGKLNPRTSALGQQLLKAGC